MAVYYKFKSAKDFDSIPIDGHFISVANLKERIFESKLGRSTGLDLVVANAQTNEEYLDEATLIPKNTSLLVRRVPLQRRMTIITNPIEPKIEENNVEHEQPANTSFTMGDSSAFGNPEETEGDEFGNDLYAIPEALQVHSINMVQEAPAPDKADEDSKIKALIDSSGLDWQMQTQDGYGAGRGFGRGMGGRMTGGRGFGRGTGFERRTTTPPQGYICHRCEVPGHFIQHCPTNGDPTYDKKRVKNPTGIPKDMLVMNPYGQYALPGGNIAEMKPDEAAFDREVEGLSSTRSVGELPPELRCPLCKEVMKDAVLTSKCCFSSFCDKCIRNRIISQSMCVCGATNILADDLLPNKTVRDTINRILESNNSSTENAGSAIQVPDTSSSRHNPAKAPSPTVSASSKGVHMPSPKKEAPDASGGQPMVNPPQQSAASGGQPVANPPLQSVEKDRTAKAAELSEVTLESMHEKEPKLQGSVSHAEEEVQQKLPTAEPGKKKKKKKTVFPGNGMEQQWRMPQDYPVENHMMPFPVENHMMPFPYPTYDPYWGGMQMGMDGYMAPPYPGSMPYMGYAPGPFDVPFGGPQGYQMPLPPPQSGPGMGFNPASSISREEFEARKADLRRKHENERRGQRDFKDSKPQRTIVNHSDSRIQGANGHGHERPPQEGEPSRHGGKSRAVIEHDHHRNHDHEDKDKASVFSRISFPEGGTSKKRKPEDKKLSNGYKDSEPVAPPARVMSNGHGHGHDDVKKLSNGVAAATRKAQARVMMEEDSSEEDEERHFKRRPTRYEPQQMEWEEDSRRSSRDHRDSHRGGRDYERQRGHTRHTHR